LQSLRIEYPGAIYQAFDFILVLFSSVHVCRDLLASRRRQHIVFGRRRLKLIARRDEQDREARRVGGDAVLSTVGAVRRWPEPVKDSGLLLLGA